MSNIGYDKTIEDEKVCQTFAFGCLLLSPSVLAVFNSEVSYPLGYLRIAKTTLTNQSDSNLNHTLPSITE